MVKKILLLISIVYTIVLVVVSLISLRDVPSLGSGFDDKIYHIIAYLGLAFLWITFFQGKKNKQQLIIVFIAVVSFGVLMEIMQYVFNPNRSYDVYDMMANGIGATLGTLIAVYLNVLKLN